MGSITDYLEDELLDHCFNAAYTPPSTVYLALCTADPTDAATGASMNEVANSGSYARTALTFAAASSRRVTQSGSITFPAATGSWGTITHWAIADVATYGAGDVLAHGEFTSSKSIVSGNTASISSGSVWVEFSAGTISNYLAHKLLDLAFRNTAYSKPDTYIALTTATISDSSTGSSITEPSSGAYARVQVNVNGGSSPTWDVSSSGNVDNTHEVAFTTATASWGTIVALATVDASSGGNILTYDNSLTDQAIDDGDTVSFAAGSLDILCT